MARNIDRQEDDQSYEAEGCKLRRDKGIKGKVEHRIIAWLGILSALMLGTALAKLMPETGPIANFKVVLLTSSAGLVAYGVNRFAIERGAPLAAIGYTGAGVASVLAISIAGSGMSVGAFSGMTHTAIDERVLTNNGSDLTHYITSVNKASIDAGRTGPALRIVAEDLARYAACEKSRSCLSRVGSGGFGPVASTLHTLSTRADSMAATFDNGELAREQYLNELNDLNTSYQKTLSQPDLSNMQRRSKLQPIHAEIEQVATALEEALPVFLLKNYAQELQSGVAIRGQRTASQNVNRILKQHGDTLVEILNTLALDDIAPPVFPVRPGMVASLEFMDDYASFAAVIFVAELVLPLTLWMLTFQKIAWEIERRSPRVISKEPDTEDYDGIVTLPKLVHPRTDTRSTTEADNNKNSRRASQFGGAQRSNRRSK